MNRSAQTACKPPCHPSIESASHERGPCRDRGAQCSACSVSRPDKLCRPRLWAQRNKGNEELFPAPAKLVPRKTNLTSSVLVLSYRQTGLARRFDGTAKFFDVPDQSGLVARKHRLD